MRSPGRLLASETAERHSRRANRQSPQSLGGARRSRDAKNRGGGDKARHSAAGRISMFCMGIEPSSPSHSPKRRAFDPRLWERTARAAAIEAAADGISNDLRAHARYRARSALGTDRRGTLAKTPGLALNSPKPRCAASKAPACPAAWKAPAAVAATAKHLLRLWRGPCRTRLCFGGCFRTSFARSLFASFRSGGRVRLRRDHAGLQRYRRHSDDRPYSACCATGCAARLGFDGVIVSDYNAVAELICHGIAGDLVEAAAAALQAGVDIDMMSGAYSQGLAPAIARGLVSIERDRCRRAPGAHA